MRCILSIRMMLVIVPLISILSCGGTSNENTETAGIGGTGITSTGEITGFGSVFVNGIEFETDANTRFLISDDQFGSEELLFQGMVVTVTGTVNADGITGNAQSISYKAEVIGPIVEAPQEQGNGVTKVLQIFGQTVILDAKKTIFETEDVMPFGYNEIQKNDVVEVSGFVDFNSASRTIVATLVKKKKLFLSEVSHRVELKGDVVSLDLPGQTFVVNDVVIQFDSSTRLENIGVKGLTNGLSVEVKGLLLESGDVSATKIEANDGDTFQKNIKFTKIEGVVSEFQGNSSFKVNGVSVDASNAKFIPASIELVAGNVVEVKGEIINSVLKADSVESRAGNLEIMAKVGNVDPDAQYLELAISPNLAPIRMLTNSSTSFEDKKNSVRRFGIRSIFPGDIVDVEAYLNERGEYIAIEVERETNDDFDAVKLEGPVSFFDKDARTITVAGVTFQTTTSTRFNLSEKSDVLVGEFFLALTQGQTLSIKDAIIDQTADGIPDEVTIGSD